jgi:hypothetical protein
MHTQLVCQTLLRYPSGFTNGTRDERRRQTLRISDLVEKCHDEHRAP